MFSLDGVGLSFLRMKADVGRDLALSALHGALIPSGDTQEALKYVVSLPVIRRASCFRGGN